MSLLMDSLRRKMLSVLLQLSLLAVSVGYAAPTAAAVPPTLTGAFSGPTVPVGGTSTLTFTVTNPNPSTSLTGVGFNVALSSKLAVANPSNLINTCGGNGQAVNVAGQGLVSLVSVTLAGGSSCTFSTDAQGVSVGVATSTTSQIGSNETSPGAPATVSITVVPSTPVRLQSFDVD